ncbi:MAG: hypothetical protein HY619_02820, partial [Thaumarchaeota archaeon]|nr:hypothetical protein [Nitrososphaerota archaeon]
VRVFVHDVSRSLGVALGFSSFVKAGGTKAMRRVLEAPVGQADYVKTLGWVSAATAGLVSGRVDDFLEFLWDVFHEPRRADAGGYGSFSSEALFGLKRRLYEEFGVVLNVSGAGPNLLFLYNKAKSRRWERKHGSSFIKSFGGVVEDFFRREQVAVEVKGGSVALGGAYDYLIKRFGVGKVSVAALFGGR